MSTHYVIPTWDVASLPVAGSSERFPVRRIFCVGRNYLEHQKEMGSTEREEPFFFCKAPHGLVAVNEGENKGVHYGLMSQNYHWETELVAVLSKADPRVPSNWSRRFKNHQEKLKSGDVYQVAEVVRNLAARNRDASLSAAERTMYERARVNLISEIAPALKVSTEEAEKFLNAALEKGVLKPAKAAKKKAEAPKKAKADDDEDDE